jgi:hypothetical protein
MTKKKSKAKAKEAKPEGSEIIKQAVIYAQSLAAHHAGFDADPTGDSEYASKLRGVGHCEKALAKLNALAGKSKTCLSPDELHANGRKSEGGHFGPA